MDVDLQLHTFRSPEVESVVQDAIRFFAQTPVHPLPPPGPFAGTGVYALYYSGDLPLYEHVAAANKHGCVLPIYVGKAVPHGWRTGRTAGRQEVGGVYGRLKEHADSLSAVADLQAQDFNCRFVILSGIETDLITSVEAELIRLHHPLWNTHVDGFGNHAPGSGRYNQARSEWDVLHPGRPWAEKLTGKAPERETVLRKVAAHGDELRSS